ncbi:MAG: hypothetical protein ACOC58_00945 [Chloroflexota bacterium]
MYEVIFFAFALLLSTLLAKVEIQMEGRHGYAEKLPVSWRSSNKWARTLFTGTSYHLYMGLFLLSMVHLPFVVGLPWTIGGEMLVLSLLAFVTVAEDFLWFVLNPAYGIRRYRKMYIPWFRDRWLGFIPLWYTWYLAAGVALYVGHYFVN